MVVPPSFKHANRRDLMIDSLEATWSETGINNKPPHTPKISETDTSYSITDGGRKKNIHNDSPTRV